MNEPKKIYLVNAEPIGDELANYKFPVIFRVMNESGITEDITYNTAGERSVLKDTNSFTSEDRTKLDSLDVEYSTLSMSSEASLTMFNSNVTFNSSSKFDMAASTFSMTSGANLTVANSAQVNINSSYKMTLGVNSNVPNTLTSGAVVFAGSAGLLAENVNTETGKVVLTSGSKAKLEIYDNNFILGGTQGIKYDSTGIKLGYNDSTKGYTLGYPLTSSGNTVLVHQSGKDAEWISKETFFNSITPSILLNIIKQANNEELISELKTLLGIVQA